MSNPLVAVLFDDAVMLVTEEDNVCLKMQSFDAGSLYTTSVRWEGEQTRRDRVFYLTVTLESLSFAYVQGVRPSEPDKAEAYDKAVPKDIQEFMSFAIKYGVDSNMTGIGSLQRDFRFELSPCDLFIRGGNLYGAL